MSCRENESGMARLPALHRSGNDAEWLLSPHSGPMICCETESPPGIHARLGVFKRATFFFLKMASRGSVFSTPLEPVHGKLKKFHRPEASAPTAEPAPCVALLPEAGVRRTRILEADDGGLSVRHISRIKKLETLSSQQNGGRCSVSCADHTNELEDAGRRTQKSPNRPQWRRDGFRKRLNPRPEMVW